MRSSGLSSVVAVAVVVAVVLCMHDVVVSGGEVTYIPGYGPPSTASYAGYVLVNESSNGNLFYWMFEAENGADDPSTPLMLWLTGGPGAASESALAFENGPIRMVNSTHFERNPYGWNKNMRAMWIDFPTGTGYSYCDEDGYVTNEKEAGQQFVNFLLGFYKQFPQYAQSPVLISAESYGGRYAVGGILPAILEYNKQAPAGAQKIPLVASTIGDGIVNPLTQFRSTPQYAFDLGYLDDKELGVVNEALAVCEDAIVNEQWSHATNSCLSMTNLIWETYAPGVFRYDVMEQGSVFAGWTAMMDEYFNSAAVKSALHVPPSVAWKSSDGSTVINKVAEALWDDFCKNSSVNLPDLLEEIPIMFYSGQYDGSCCNGLGTTWLLDELVWSGAKGYANADRTILTCPDAPAGQPTNPAGFLRKYENLYHLYVMGAGHLVPNNVPAFALSFVDNFITEVLGGAAVW